MTPGAFHLAAQHCNGRLRYSTRLVKKDVAIPVVFVLAAWNSRKVVSDWRYRARIAVFAIGSLTATPEG
jgi:hypothetical protein